MIKTFLNNKEFNVTDVNKTMVTCIIYDFSIDNLTINLHKHLSFSINLFNELKVQTKNSFFKITSKSKFI